MKKVIKNEFIKYIFFAVLVSVVNVLTYLVCIHFICKNNILLSNLIAYVLSILLSFITNKRYVYKNKSKQILRQGISFLGVKFTSFIIDSIVLVICRNVLHMPQLWSKIISNSSTTFSNYYLNKLVVFK